MLSNNGPVSDRDADRIQVRYETRQPSEQTIADIFQGSWKSALPNGIISGQTPMFENDMRPRWLNHVLPGGISGKSVLELGPFEGYQTYWLDKLGAAEIVSVEGNNINFLKCLCLKEMFGLKAALKHGSVILELENPGRRYDIVWASGVLYHMDDPVRFLESACKTADAIYLWTHYFEAEKMKALAQENGPRFLSHLDQHVQYKGRDITLHARTYGIEGYEQNIPLYWEGAPADTTRWLELEDIYFVLEQNGFQVLATEFIGEMDGIPTASFAAVKR